MTDVVRPPGEPTTVPCPDCGGAGRVDHAILGVPRSVCMASKPCETCWPRNEDGSLKAWNDGTAGTVEATG